MPVIVPFPLSVKPAHTEQSLTITCAISDGDLPINLFWSFNNQPITSDMDVSIAKLGKRTSVLTIDSVGGHHAGLYSCHGKNAAGSTSYSTELKVIGVFEIHVFYVFCCCCCSREKKKKSAFSLCFEIFYSFHLSVLLHLQFDHTSPTVAIIRYPIYSSKQRLLWTEHFEMLVNYAHFMWKIET